MNLGKISVFVCMEYTKHQLVPWTDECSASSPFILAFPAYPIKQLQVTVQSAALGIIMLWVLKYQIWLPAAQLQRGPGE